MATRETDGLRNANRYSQIGITGDTTDATFGNRHGPTNTSDLDGRWYIYNNISLHRSTTSHAERRSQSTAAIQPLSYEDTSVLQRKQPAGCKACIQYWKKCTTCQKSLIVMVIVLLITIAATLPPVLLKTSKRHQSGSGSAITLGINRHDFLFKFLAHEYTYAEHKSPHIYQLCSPDYDVTRAADTISRPIGDTGAGAQHNIYHSTIDTSVHHAAGDIANWVSLRIVNVEYATEEGAEGEYEVAQNESRDTVTDTKFEGLGGNVEELMNCEASEIGAQAAESEDAETKESEIAQCFGIIWSLLRAMGYEEYRENIKRCSEPAEEVGEKEEGNTVPRRAKHMGLKETEEKRREADNYTEGQISAARPQQDLSHKRRHLWGVESQHRAALQFLLV
ncbi:uncharacterized protein BKCO1_37000189 [Diplodia corticola]|uniref:Uncharacterized protein n=1 Tax=Diplodia corticola TaxID=236234 RepID=A0A1J9QW15_9PEZI|nr:uncharacterized protein BKCO1_37000189 [Diplodia corticola]OJD32608.1 hypothetical protein BKCO1_37000189 [Diplodia corticola]